ncbi:hypothetical protein V8C35DRAFT_266871 [Trichoderma chlorosporum]
MSWTKRSQEMLYRDFTEKAALESVGVGEKPWGLEVWDISEDGQLCEHVQNTVRRLSGKPQLRIVFAPLDVPRRETKGLMVELFHKFNIPHDFTAERARSTNHSFSRRSDGHNEFSSWFRFSCISAACLGTDVESPAAEDDATEGDKLLGRDSAFFLQASKDKTITLLCFGAGPIVKRRMYDLTKSQAWADVATNPEILFDVVLEGLHEELDDTARELEKKFATLEQSINRRADSQRASSSPIAPFEELYLFSRHMIELSTAIESVIMINEGVLMNIGANIPSTTSSNINSDRRLLVGVQLKECLEYRRTLFRSLQMKLSNFQKRIEAATALASNLALQQQSAAMIQGPVSMKLIAASIVVFLPTITVATIAGSRLLLSEQLEEEGSWNISATPLFYLLWYISIPLTLAVVILSLCWLWWRQGEIHVRRTTQPSSWLNKAMIWRHTKGTTGNNEESRMPV